jgi:phosphatidylserine decarboxylase
MIAPGGYKIIIITMMIFIIAIVITIIFPYLIAKVITVILGMLLIFNLFFFRDPERKIPQGDTLIVSPADGKIVKMDEIYEPYYFKDTVRRVSIFLSVLNVHVNRIPISGKVDFLKYIKGKFGVAYDDKASEDNEQSIIAISNGHNKLLFKQIAGIIARRIEYNIAESDSVTAGKRFGLIRYGSRVDMFFPEHVILRVKLHDNVYGGETVIGEFK